MFIHTVYFYMKPEATDAHRDQLLRDCREILSRISTVKQLWAGVPAGTPRDVVDNSYGVSITVLFDDTAGYDVYETAPLHIEFIERNKANWSRVQVYDAVE